MLRTESFNGESDSMTAELTTAKRLVEFLEQDGYKIDTAVWVVDEEGSGRLYLVPQQIGASHLKEMIRVASTISVHKDELPARLDLRYSVVDSKDPVIQAIKSLRAPRGRVRGIFKDGTYIDTAYVLRPAA
jgi:hypothetical protein